LGQTFQGAPCRHR